MKKIAIILLCFSIFLSACSSVQTLAAEVKPTVEAVLTNEPANTHPAANELLPTPTCTATAAATPAPTTVSDEATLRQALSGVISAAAWPKLGMPADLAKKWQAFAGGQGSLSAQELQTLAGFLSRWEALNQLIQKGAIPAGTSPGLRVKEIKGPNGEMTLVLYVVDEQSAVQNGAERLFLITHSSKGQAAGLVLAPEVAGFSQQISPDGEYVQYLDGRGKCIVTADAVAIGTSTPHEKELKTKLDIIYQDASNSFYVKASVYPRFIFPFPGVVSGFFGLDATLSANQFVLLYEALDLFNRPVFEPLKAYLFKPETAYMAVDKIGGQAAGVTFTGTGVVELDRKDLFGNKYELMSVVSHEGSHVLQGNLPAKYTCKDMLRLEIGDGTIPQDFYSWTADQLMQGIIGGQIGAYHVSLWTLNKLGIQNIGWVRQAILTGMVDNQSVVDCSQ